jgi:hypothetical protein
MEFQGRRGLEPPVHRSDPRMLDMRRLSYLHFDYLFTLYYIFMIVNL